MSLINAYQVIYPGSVDERYVRSRFLSGFMQRMDEMLKIIYHQSIKDRLKYYFGFRSDVSAMPKRIGRN